METYTTSMDGADDHYDDVKEAGGAADGAEERSPSKKLKVSRKVFNLDHIDAVSRDGRFLDFSGGIAFTGRGEFAVTLASAIKDLIFHISENGGQLFMVRGTALVYSTVPGVGKTRSMLELQNTLSSHLKTSYETGSTWETGNEITIDSVHFGYSGFNSNLHLSNDEFDLITDELSAKRVLFRRIVGSVLVQTPSATSLPTFRSLYGNCNFPSIKDLKTMLVGRLRRENEDRTKVTLVLVGVDEVQLLNKAKKIYGQGLGRLFLRYIRQWQTELIEDNILLVAVGTGVTLDFLVDGSTGRNKVLSGNSDTVLIKKEDFRALAVAKYTSREAAFDQRYGKGAKEAICDKVTELWWPRVRLIEHWRPNNFEIPAAHCDSNSESWFEWMTRWMLDKPFRIHEREFLPGNTKERVIGAVFEMWQDIGHYKVTPDFTNMKVLVLALIKSTPEAAVQNIYSYLPYMAPMLDPSKQVISSTSFEKYGFHVIGSSLYFGIQILSVDRKGISEYSTPVHAKRLGLAKWVHNKLPGFKPTNVLVLGIGQACKSAFYPYTDRCQTTLLSEVKDALDCQDKSYSTVFIHTGDQAKCDYLYLFRKRFGEKWIALVADGKFDGVDTGTVSAGNQIKLIDAAICLKSALSDQLQDHRTLIFTNMDQETVAGSEAYEEAVKRYQAAFEGRSVDVEMVNEKTFEFSPFSNVIFMHRNRSF